MMKYWNQYEFFDPLYGRIHLNIPVEILKCPEVQRLREIRLCNINSPYLTGGSNISRFEHAVGTAYLSSLLIQKNVDFKDISSEFFVASLIHDVVTGPFGHSLEYIFEAYGRDEYEHANLKTLLGGRTIYNSKNFYFGKKSRLSSIGDLIDINILVSILDNSHAMSKYLSAKIDIDNIDNVFRFAYHLGMKFDSSLPVKIAETLRYNCVGDLVLNINFLALYEKWFHTRVELYTYLLENIGEFSSKALLERAFIEMIKDEVIDHRDWNMTDMNFAILCYDNGNDIARESISRLMHMDLFAFNIIYESREYELIDKYLMINKIHLIEEAFKHKVYLHFIRDVDKTYRPLRVKLEDDFINIGACKDRYLIGFFGENKKAINEVARMVKEEIGVEFNKLYNDKIFQ